MFTVVISEQTHLDSIQEYKSFLKPFLDKKNIAFCRWRPDGACLSDAVPELTSTVSRHEQWRLIVVCNEDGLHQKNPFEIVPYRQPEWPKNTEQAEYLELVRKEKFAAFEVAAQQPLTRLMTWLCTSPTVSDNPSPACEEDPEFREYLAEFQRKLELREAICAGGNLNFTRPAEILCLAKRCYSAQEYDIRTSWMNHFDRQYSRFYDWNLYFDKMRYLLFDILPKNHNNYTFDYIRFLYALMLLAAHDIPSGCLNPNWVYVLNCENNEDALRQLLTRYDVSLSMTQDELNGQLHEIARREKRCLRDPEAEQIFCSSVTMPVTAAGEFDSTTLYISSRGLGLAKDCPTDEEKRWDAGYRGSRRALTRFLKQPRRALKRATSEMRSIRDADLDYAELLNEFQLEDLEEHIGDQELKMVSTTTCDLYHMERYTEQMEKEDGTVRTIIDSRMSRKQTISLGATALLCFLAGFLPLLFPNIATKENTIFALLITGGAIALLAAIGFVCLLCLRQVLKHGFSQYNGVMHEAENEVNGSMQAFSKYLSYACNVMRGYSVLNFRRENESADSLQSRILKKHLIDLQRTREELREVFGQFLSDHVPPDSCTAEAFAYDFSRPVDYQYPIPYSADQKTRIEFLQTGNLVEIPVDFVKCLSVRREELYA